MRKFKKIIIGLLAITTIVSSGVATPVNATMPPLQATIIHSENFCDIDHVHVEKGYQIGLFAACTHVGTERATHYIGRCNCGGFLYKVTCKPCGAFISGLCSNMFCTYF